MFPFSKTVIGFCLLIAAQIQGSQFGSYSTLVYNNQPLTTESSQYIPLVSYQEGHENILYLDLKDGSEHHVCTYNGAEFIAAIALDQDREYIVYNAGKDIFIHNIRNGELIGFYSVHTNNVEKIIVSKNIVVSVSVHELVIFDVNQKNVCGVVEIQDGLASPVVDLVIQHNDHNSELGHVAFAQGTTIKVHFFNGAQCFTELEHESQLVNVGYQRDQMLALDENGWLYTWNLHDQQVVQKKKTPFKNLAIDDGADYYLARHADGRLFILTSDLKVSCTTDTTYTDFVDPHVNKNENAFVIISLNSPREVTMASITK